MAPSAITRGPLGIAGAIGFVGLFAVTIHGFVLGPRLIGLVGPLTVRTSVSGPTVGRAAIVSLAHHLLVTASCALVGLAMETWIWPALTAPPLLLGAAHALLLRRARATLDRLDRDDACQPA